MNRFFVIRCLVNLIAVLGSKKYGAYNRSVRLHSHWGFDLEKKEYTIVDSLLKFRRHKSTNVEEVYRDRPFVDSKGSIHQKGWYPAQELQQQGSYFIY